MSRMTKYLKQKAVVEVMKVDEHDKPILDMYGDPSYHVPVTIPCRRERVLQDIQTTTGSIVRSSTTYYTDETISVKVGDKFDGKPVIDFEEYVDGRGIIEGYRVIVV